MTVDRRTFLAASAAFFAQSSPVRSQLADALRPEDFGARGDGRTNDTAAFAALSREVERRGGGTISLRAKRTYVVGHQQRGTAMGWAPSPVLELSGLTSPLRIMGNGARLFCQPGLRFGTFDPASGSPVQRQMPNLNASALASPYNAMIAIRNCTAPVAIADLELDGNLERLMIGGRFGDSGWQVPGPGRRRCPHLRPAMPVGGARIVR